MSVREDSTILGETAIRQHMEAMVKLRMSMALPPKFAFAGMDDLLLKHGKLFPITTERQRRMAEPKQCFSNSQQLVLYTAEDLTYCEGYIYSPKLMLPIHHGWCIDSKGHVVDVTLRHGRRTTTYFGVAFKNSYVEQQVYKHNMWGTLLDTPWSRWPLLTGQHSLEDALV